MDFAKQWDLAVFSDFLPIVSFDFINTDYLYAPIEKEELIELINELIQ